MDSIYLEAMRVQSYITNVYTDAVRRFGVNVAGAHIITALLEEGDLRPADLIIRTGMTSGGITVTLDLLEEGEFIQRVKAQYDKRCVVVTLTDTGRRSAELVRTALAGAHLIVNGAFLQPGHVARAFVEAHHPTSTGEPF